MYSEHHYTRSPFVAGATFLFIVIIAEFIAIMLLNNGHFVYTLDDPYIHLALAENIRNLHYGVNPNEFSAPSSSILWPFIIAPFSSLEYFPLLVNVVSAILTLFIFRQILNVAININDKGVKTILVSTMLILLALGTNIIGLAFTGMEHSLQQLAVVAIAWGLIVEAENNKVEPWLLVAIVAAPLIRYENLAISLAALTYLSAQKYYIKSILASLLLALFMGGFSIFLTLSGLELLPTSVLAKSFVAASSGSVSSIMKGMRASLENPKGMLLCVGLSGHLGYLCFARQNKKKRQLAAVTIFAIALHLVAGQYGWHNRYEIYIWSFLLLMSVYLASGKITNLLAGNKSRTGLAKFIVVPVIFTLLTCFSYIEGLISLPIASNNIYEQQFQMRRFAVDYYKKPVAVNDLGYVSYKNNNYVLDLYGLASLEALNYRKTRQDFEWMNNLANEKKVGLAMVYDNWFKVPGNWIKVGELHLGKERITPSRNKVAFYALGNDAYEEIVLELNDFLPTLPEDVKFIFQPKNGTNKAPSPQLPTGNNRSSRIADTRAG